MEGRVLAGQKAALDLMGLGEAESGCREGRNRGQPQALTPGLALLFPGEGLVPLPELFPQL